jgi:hypothetical protein
MTGTVSDKSCDTMLVVTVSWTASIYFFLIAGGHHGRGSGKLCESISSKRRRQAVNQLKLDQEEGEGL